MKRREEPADAARRMTQTFQTNRAIHMRVLSEMAPEQVEGFDQRLLGALMTVIDPELFQSLVDTARGKH